MLDAGDFYPAKIFYLYRIYIDGYLEWLITPSEMTAERNG